jgi:hypothetical protein
MNDPCLQLFAVGADRAEPHRDVRPFTVLVACSLSSKLFGLILLFANLLTRALTSQRCFHTLFFPRFQVKGVALNLFNNVLLLYFALEAAESVFERFTLLQPNFRQTDTPPDPSGRTSSYYKELTGSQEEARSR